ncbi:hypothetical protein HO173_001280 [Letharia columbiana]|uniref:Uncharacterized protein n=1 Tax=Letharia columbiana TaxID=112416 RepID=A0A8H6L9D5_9LECA|nr:uncharacterized protein HO173_001280 [Letharia columbiana]KAF6240609.1 hypothetical protein HO173_001280 [Letharia columbiana]
MPHATTLSAPPKVVDVAIIGAGWYGLVAARTYLRLEPDTNIAIIESANSVGGVWSKDRIYPNLVAQVKHGLFNYTDTPMPKEGATKNDLVTGYMIQDYLEKYARDHDLLRRIQFNNWVEKAERCPRGWRLRLKGSGNIIETAKLMVATGVTSIPNMPEFDMSEASIPLTHSRDLGASVEDLKSDDVQSAVVVGAAKSAYDAVYLLLSMGKKVTWLIRPDGSGPMPILPTEMFGCNSIAVGSTRLMSYLSPSIINSTGPICSFFQRTAIGRWITGAFWDNTTHMSEKDAGFAKGDHIAALKPEVKEKSAFWCNSGLGIVTIPDFWPTLHGGDLKVVRDNIDSVKGDSLLLQSGDVLHADYIVSCTGWGDHFGMFDAELKTELGLPAFANTLPGGRSKEDIAWEKHDVAATKTVDERLPFLAQGPELKTPKANDASAQRRWRLYKRAVPLNLALKDDRSLVILGQIHTIQTPMVSEIQSFWSILYLLGELDLPDEATMTREIAEWNVWTRKRYISQGQKFPYCIFDFLPYLDGLCEDAGINPRRKGNFLSELFSPYRPEDFRGFVDEYLAKRPPRKSLDDGSSVGSG